MNQKKSSTLKLVKRPTPWLKEVPPGKYTIKQLEEITGKHYCTIKQRLRVLGLSKTYIAINNYPIAVYEWPGIKKYEQQNKKKAD